MFPLPPKSTRSYTLLPYTTLFRSEFDDLWYVTGSVGYNFQDSGRLTDDAPFGTIGVGKFLTPNWSIDGELNYQNPNFADNDDLNYSQYGISFDARYHF